MKGSAVISDDGRYRYRLERDNLGGKLSVAFICLNPSTADAEINDPTVRRLMGYAMKWNMGSLLLGNLFAYRSTKPSKLKIVKDPIGPENDEYLLDIARRSAMTIAAWGTHGGFLFRDAAVIKLFKEADIPLHCLGLTKQGFPKHPLYLRADTQPELFVGA